MHLFMMLAVAILAWFFRLDRIEPMGNWSDRYSRVLLLFLFPPLLLLTTAISVVCMGPEGEMVDIGTGWLSYLLASGFLGWVVLKWLKAAIKGWVTVRKVRRYPQLKMEGKICRLLDTPIPYCAQIGFWQPELVVSQGLLEKLDRAHLEAVLAHEKAHCYYRDTFGFFWLGWMGSIAPWLPNTESLWQELLVLRELRADSWAAKFVDPLLLAESLLQVVSYPAMESDSLCATFSSAVRKNRLQQRIDALLGEPESARQLSWWSWVLLLTAFLPLIVIPFHS
ncbi:MULTISPECIES: M56 family metallopeptidase [Aerosakkonema]|uniref:M56 family metallopeptidase n=1 Tax=Aerosakkonema TaxID=1246629 RepID=UPI0035B6D6ED